MGELEEVLETKKNHIRLRYLYLRLLLLLWVLELEEKGEASAVVVLMAAAKKPQTVVVEHKMSVADAAEENDKTSQLLCFCLFNFLLFFYLEFSLK